MAPRWGTERVPEDSNGYAHATVTFFLLSCPPSNVLSNNVSFFFLIITIIFVEIRGQNSLDFWQKNLADFYSKIRNPVCTICHNIISWKYFKYCRSIYLLVRQASKDSSRTNLVLRYFEETSLSLSLLLNRWTTRLGRVPISFSFASATFLLVAPWPIVGRKGKKATEEGRCRR